jgi:hypothetical protein
MDGNLFDTGIRPAVDAYLAEQAAKRRDYGDYWSASSAGYCMRKNIFDRLGVPPTSDDPYKTRIFESGHIFHEWMQRITKDAGLSIASEVELQDEDLMIRGHIDDLILQDKHLILYDYKTAHSSSFKWKKKQPMGHYHTMQLATYMYMLRKRNTLKHKTYDGVKNLTDARILSISKDDLRLHETQLLWSPDLEKKVVQYWSTLNGYWKEKKIPQCTCLDYDGGFLGKKSAKGKVYNPYWYNDEPCSLEWYRQWKESKKEQVKAPPKGIMEPISPKEIRDAV